MKNISNLIKKSIIILVISFIVATLSYYAIEDHWYRQFIPQNIGLLNKIKITGESGGLKGCGTAIYKLSKEAYQNIKEHGLEFLNSDLQPRKNSEHLYVKWKETPREDWIREEDFAFELLCGGELPDELYKEIVKSGKKAGSFYTKKHEAVLMIIPEKRLVIFSHNG